MNAKMFPGQDSLSGGQRAVMQRIMQAALAAADPAMVISQAVALHGDVLMVGDRSFPLSSVERIKVVGAGKAAEAMARGLWAVLGDRITGAVLVTKHASEDRAGLPDSFEILTGGHPLPNEDSISGTGRLVQFLADTTCDDLVICLISGGGSALLTWPQEGVALADMQALTSLLLASGATINEMNTLRKHLDRVKGGGLAAIAAPAKMITLILSDVIGSPLDVIASGPSVPDSSTYQEGFAILQKYQLLEKTPPAIRKIFERGMAGELPETRKAGDPIFARVVNRVVASNLQAAQAALEQARSEGFNTNLLTTYLQGEAAQAGAVLASLLKQISVSGQPLARPACLVAGGETTVTLRGSGLGGRNQELALGAVPLLADVPDVALLTLGTDGEDGPTDAAGALVTGSTQERARQMGLQPQSYLQANDSYHFFLALNDLLIIGPTGTNVNDLVFLFAF